MPCGEADLCCFSAGFDLSRPISAQAAVQEVSSTFLCLLGLAWFPAGVWNVVEIALAAIDPTLQERTGLGCKSWQAWIIKLVIQ